MNLNEIYQKVTNKIVDNLKNAGSWRKMWQAPSPVSLNKHFYNGVNFLLLENSKYESNVWGTFNQVRENGGTVKKGEKAESIVFWKWLNIEDKETGKLKKVPLLKEYYIFNSNQCNFDEIGKKKINELENISKQIKEIRHAEAEQIINNIPDKPQIINITGNLAAYNPKKDVITVPFMKYFNSSDDYYNVLFHELIHSTGHTKRLNRFIDNKSSSFGSEEYSKEELVAEIGNAYLSEMAGIKENINNNAAYINSWCKALNDNQSWIVWAANKAQQATDYILNIKNS